MARLIDPYDLVDGQHSDSDEMVRWMGEWVTEGEYEHGEGLCNCLEGDECDYAKNLEEEWLAL
jgi:hypothetical protein